MSKAHTVRETAVPAPAVTRIAGLGVGSLQALLARYGLRIVRVGHTAAIPASFWGDAEAGRAGARVYVRADTPVHSVLHEAGHYVCMDARRRAAAKVDAGGDYAEENGVCFWQILAADHIAGFDRARMCADMDAWGYTFRLGSAAAWFERDAEDARAWLIAAGVIAAHDDSLSFALRG